ncbi:MAG: hypothetical protein D6675_03225 [Gemmatimonadetes bacterium]|nr:MAG: hypothetical protein D6675_03225 [Gemmatimonadota bacterium]
MTDFKVGDRIEHPRFGQGTIVKIEGDTELDDIRLLIEFSDGKKSIDPAYAPIEIIGTDDTFTLKETLRQVIREELNSLQATATAGSSIDIKAAFRDIIAEELGITPVELGDRWIGGTLYLQPGREGLKEKEIPIETFFHKIVMVRDRLRVLEQQINSHPKLDDEDKVNLQQYITRCYGSLTTFNVLFKERSDWFVGSSHRG